MIYVIKTAITLKALFVIVLNVFSPVTFILSHYVDPRL